MNEPLACGDQGVWKRSGGGDRDIETGAFAAQLYSIEKHYSTISAEIFPKRQSEDR